VIVVIILAIVVHYLLLGYFFVMWGRLILDLAQTVVRDWRPRGFTLVLTELVYGLTDPPIRLARKYVKPIRVGSISLDLAWSVVMLAVLVLMFFTTLVAQL